MLALANDTSLITPEWPAPANVKAYVSTRLGGVGVAAYDSLNLGLHVGDDVATVRQNRDRFQAMTRMPTIPYWLQQVHGTKVLTLPALTLPMATLPEMKAELALADDLAADAATTQAAQQVCAVLTADCLPLLFCNQQGTQVAAAHAGWRGLCNGIIENTVATFSREETVMAWLGPAIGPDCFEVGAEVRAAFIAQDPQAELAFQPHRSGKWLANLYVLATQRLQRLGITHIYGGNYCTYTQQSHFFSYRRNGISGRMASVIWFDNPN